MCWISACPAASRTEATAAAYDLAVALGDEKRERVIGDAVLMACRFIMNNQYRTEISYFLPAPDKAAGGVRGGPVDNTVRVDFNQHAMIALLGGLRVLDHRAARPPGEATSATTPAETHSTKHFE